MRRPALGLTVLLAAGVIVACVQAASYPAPPAAKGQGPYLVVTRPMFLRAVAPLAGYRRAEGLGVVVSAEPVDQAIRSCGVRPAMILLVGDDQGTESSREPWFLPARRAGFYRWRSTQRQDIPSDALWGDLDGDGLPDVPVGRLPVRTAAQAAALVAKIISYESRPPSLEDLTIPIWAGSGQWGSAADLLAGALLTGGLERLAPRWVQPWIIFGSADSPFCHWPLAQARAFQDQFRRGGALIFLIGHGTRRHFYSMDFGGRMIGYDAAAASATLAEGTPAGPMVILACYCGDFAGSDDCLAEALLKAPGGPVAVIAAATESHPLPNYFSAQAVAAAWGQGHRRLGEFWLAAQRDAYRAQNPLIEAMLAEVEGTLEARIDTDRLRRDQMLLYALLGDPATRLKLPQPLHGQLRYADGRWHWRVERPADADALHVSFRPAGQKLPPPSPLTDQATAEQTHHAANAVYAFQPVTVLNKDQPWEGTIDAAGTLRLVAVGASTIYAAGLPLAQPSAP